VPLCLYQAADVIDSSNNDKSPFLDQRNLLSCISKGDRPNRSGATQSSLAVATIRAHGGLLMGINSGSRCLTSIGIVVYGSSVDKGKAAASVVI
jgi:hypothetical protein